MDNFDYYRPRTAAEASNLLATVERSHAKAGGTDLVPMLKETLTLAGSIVSLLSSSDLGGIENGPQGLFIGATASIADVAAHADVMKHAPGVASAAEKTATPLVRNRATVGGNLAQRPRCWYFRNPLYPCLKKGGDTCYAKDGENKYHAIFQNGTCCMVHPSNLAPALWAHGARVHVLGPDGERTVDMGSFFAPPGEKKDSEVRLERGEVIRGVQLEVLPAGSGTSYIEVREKQSFDWALVSAACRVDREGDVIKDARVVVSAVAPTPLRREAAERAVRGRRLTEELALSAGMAAAAGATPLEANGYKVRMLRACVAEALLEAWRNGEER